MKYLKIIVHTFISIGIVGCTTNKLMVKDQYMTLDEVIHFTDSISKKYYVDSKLNINYIKGHPILYSKRKNLEDKILYASPVGNWVTFTDSLGEFNRIPNLTIEQKNRIEVMKDSMANNMLCAFGGIMGKVALNKESELLYDIAYSQLNTENPIVLHCDVHIVNMATSDTIRVEAKNHRCQVISNPPLVFVSVFDVDYEGQTFVFHEIYDIRVQSSKNKTTKKFTRGIYQIK